MAREEPIEEATMGSILGASEGSGRGALGAAKVPARTQNYCQNKQCKEENEVVS